MPRILFGKQVIRKIFHFAMKAPVEPLGIGANRPTRICRGDAN
jgi:hypothetical protein